MPKALLTCHHLLRHVEALRPQYEALGVEIVAPEAVGQQFDAAAMRALIIGVDGVIAGDDEIDESVLKAGRDAGLKAVVKWGIGTDSIDKAAAKRLDIPVYNTPGVFSDEVADLALSLLLMLTRQTHRMHQSVVDGGWLQIEGRTLAGKTAGVVGLGSIGRGVARRVAALGMEVIGSDVAEIDPALLSEFGVVQAPFDRVLTESDVILIACALTPENRHLFDAGAFEHMRDGVFIVNVSRGPLIDEAALADALASGKIAGAGLDVFEVEPLPAESPLRKFDNCVFCTHNGSNTREAVARINQMSTDILFHAIGVKPVTAFTPNRVA